MNIGHGTDSGSHRPMTGTLAWRVLYLWSVQRLASRPPALSPDPEDFPGAAVLDQLFPRRFVEDGDRAFLDEALEQLPGVGIAVGRAVVEFMDAVRAGQIGEFDADRRMLMLLRVAAEAFEPLVVAAHLLGPNPHHGLRHGVGSAQRGQIGGGLFSRRR